METKGKQVARVTTDQMCAGCLCMPLNTYVFRSGQNEPSCSSLCTAPLWVKYKKASFNGLLKQSSRCCCQILVSLLYDTSANLSYQSIIGINEFYRVLIFMLTCVFCLTLLMDGPCAANKEDDDFNKGVIGKRLQQCGKREKDFDPLPSDRSVDV